MLDPQFSRKLTAKFVLCNMQDPQFSRKWTAKFVLCNMHDSNENFAICHDSTGPKGNSNE